jgi:hypothetical protein
MHACWLYAESDEAFAAPARAREDQILAVLDPATVGKAHEVRDPRKARIGPNRIVARLLPSTLPGGCPTQQRHVIADT